MNRSTAAWIAVLAMTVQGCSTNLFGASERSAAVPASAAAKASAGGEAAPKGPPELTRLSRFDVNTDGIVQRAELEETLKVDFTKEDANGNEALDAAEARGLNERLRGEPGTSPVFDWNGDGRLVYAEFATQWRTLFDRADRNGDGSVDGEEIKSSGRERKPRPLPEPTFSGKDGRPPGTPN